MLMTLFILFITNIFIINFFFNIIQNSLDENTLKNSLLNLALDFEAINFPLNFGLNLFFIAVIISVFNTILIYKFIYLKFNIDNPISFIKNFVYLFFINFSVLLSVLYLLRIYFLPRSILLLLGILHPLLFLTIISILKTNFLSKKTYFRFGIVFLILSIFIIYAFLDKQKENINVEVINSPKQSTTTLPITLSETEGKCFEWLGSNNYEDCLTGASFEIKGSFDERLTNIVNFQNDTYLLQNNGIVYKYLNGPYEVFLDISEDIGTSNTSDKWSECFESGLFSLAFHPIENYFIISYSDLKNNLVFEKFEFKDKKTILFETRKIVLKIANPVCEHYSGNIIWSDYFEDFLISIGDMKGSKTTKFSAGDNNAMDTTSLKGKIFLLNKEITDPALISENNNSSSLKNLVAIGLRNPWKTSEYNGYLFIPDVGWSSNEELNVVKLNDLNKINKPFNFGWPFFEGLINNELIFSNLSVWNKNNQYSIVEYVEENSILPIVYYQRPAPDSNRAAIIGGDIIRSKNSKYFEHYIFADFLSKEIFVYDFKNNKLFSVPLPNEFTSYITSLSINNFDDNSVLITTGSGLLYEIQLP